MQNTVLSRSQRLDYVWLRFRIDLNYNIVSGTVYPGICLSMTSPGRAIEVTRAERRKPILSRANGSLIRIAASDPVQL